MKTGKDSVVIGNVSPDSEVGEASVVIGPTHSDGSIRIGGGFSAGRGAEAGESSIAIGANTKAGVPRKQLTSASTKEASACPPDEKPQKDVKKHNKSHGFLALVAIGTISGVLVLLCGYFITKYLGIQL